MLLTCSSISFAYRQSYSQCQSEEIDQPSTTSHFNRTEELWNVRISSTESPSDLPIPSHGQMCVMLFGQPSCSCPPEPSFFYELPLSLTLCSRAWARTPVQACPIEQREARVWAMGRPCGMCVALTWQSGMVDWKRRRREFMKREYERTYTRLRQDHS